jgi:hypothetical protein
LLTGAGNAVDESRNLLAETDKATHRVEQHKDEERDGEEAQRMPYGKKYNSCGQSERCQPWGRLQAVFHLQRVQRCGHLQRFLVQGRGSAVKFDGFGDLMKALTFSSKRGAYVMECCISEHGLIHALDVGQYLGSQQQSALFDQLSHFRKAQLGIAEDLRGAGPRSVGDGRVLRVHLFHRLFQRCHVFDNRNDA